VSRASSVRPVRAALTRGPDQEFEFADLELTGPGPGEVLVRLVATGVCHTDLVIRSGLPAGSPPAVLGHEGAGVVEAVGPGVDGVAVDDHVLLSFASCGRCPRCRSGRSAYCEQFAALNLPRTRSDGPPVLAYAGAPVLSHFFGQSSFATHALVSPRDLVVVDQGVDLVTSAPLGCGFQTGAGAVLNVLAPSPDDTVVVIGLGGVGLAAVLAALSADVGTVIGVDLVESRRAKALALGAAAAIDPAEGGLVDQIRAAVPSGADKILDTTGNGGVIADAAASLAPLGTLVVVGLGPPDVTVDIVDLIGGGKSIRGSIEGDAEPQRLLPELLRLREAGRLPLEQLVTRYAFTDINVAIADMRAGATIKPVLVFDD
jgi:aryl-alcohol dehydrogenase